MRTSQRVFDADFTASHCCACVLCVYDVTTVGIFYLHDDYQQQQKTRAQRKSDSAFPEPFHFLVFSSAIPTAQEDAAQFRRLTQRATCFSTATIGTLSKYRRSGRIATSNRVQCNLEDAPTTLAQNEQQGDEARNL